IDTIKSAMAKNEPNRSSAITPCENATAGSTSPLRTRETTLPSATTSAPNAIALYTLFLSLPFSRLPASIAGIARPTEPSIIVTSIGEERRSTIFYHVHLSLSPLQEQEHHNYHDAHCEYEKVCLCDACLTCLDYSRHVRHRLL